METTAAARDRFVKWLKENRPIKPSRPIAKLVDDQKVTPVLIRETALAKRIKQMTEKSPLQHFSILANRPMTIMDKLFDAQATRLFELEFDKYARVKPEVFWEYISRLGLLVKNIKPKPDCIPFLIVIPQGVIKLQQQAERLQIDCQGGSNLMARNILINAENVQTPARPYLAVNVNIGAKLKGVAPDEACKRLNRFWRRCLPLTIDEGFAIATHHPGLLNLHSVDFAGTQFDASGTPGMMKRDDGLWICRRPKNLGAPNRAIAFCHQRIAL